MKFSEITVYNYKNKPKKVQLPDKEIHEIWVQILSGDETGYVSFNDGSVVRFDACPNGRIIGYDDGSYTISGDKMLVKWAAFIPEVGRTVSYARQDWFWGEENE